MLTLRRILVPTDFSESAEAALRQAELGAAKHGADVHVLHVIDAQCPSVPADPDEVPTVHATRKADSVVDGILAYAEEHDVDLVVMGTHGWTSLKWFTLGSVAEAVMRTAPCPVLSIKGYGKSLVEKAGADAPSADTTATRDLAPGTEAVRTVSPPHDLQHRQNQHEAHRHVHTR